MLTKRPHILKQKKQKKKQQQQKKLQVCLSMCDVFCYYQALKS